LASSAEQGAAQTKQSLSSQVESFKAESQRTLDKLSASLNELGSKAEGKADESREDLKRQLAETKQSLDNVSARTESELEETRQKLRDKIAELGRKVNQGLDKAGDATEKALK
jgi:phage shock protein A